MREWEKKEEEEEEEKLELPSCARAKDNAYTLPQAADTHIHTHTEQSTQTDT